MTIFLHKLCLRQAMHAGFWRTLAGSAKPPVRAGW